MKRIGLLIILCCHAHAATFTVINTNNSGAGSLLQAILDANTAGGNSTIDFNIPGVGPHIIAPTAFYSVAPNRIYPPFVNDNITLDATTQSGYVLGSPAVIIDANAVLGTGSCLAVVGANNCIIKGIGVTRYVNGGSGRGVSIEASSTAGADNNQVLECQLGSFGGFGNTRALVLGGNNNFGVSNTLIDSNVLSGNSIAGLQCQFNVHNSIIQNNYIGCNFGGTAAVGNAYGVVILANGGPDAPNNIVQNNVISGNSILGVVIQGSTTSTVSQNTIGLNAAQTALLGATTIGVLVVGVGADEADNNTISGNTIGGCTNGVVINDNANNNRVINNYIGTNSSGANLGNLGSGLLIQGGGSGPCSENLTQGNIIRFNGFSVVGDNFGVQIGAPAAIVAFSEMLDATLVDCLIDVGLRRDKDNLGTEPTVDAECVGAIDRLHSLENGDKAEQAIFKDPLNPDILNAILANNIDANNLDGISLQYNSNNNQIPVTIIDAGITTLHPNLLMIHAVAPVLPILSNFRLDFFVNTINRNPITEGARYIGSVTSVPSGQAITAVFNVTSPLVVPGNFVSGTATNLNNGGLPGDSSPYSLNTTVTTFCVSCEEVNAMDLSVVQWLKLIYFSLVGGPCNS